MAHPGDIGRAEIEVGADTSPFPGEAKRGVEAGLHEVDPSFKKAGKEWGDTASKSLGERVKSRVPEIVNKAIADINRNKIKEHIKIEPDYDVDETRKVTRKIAKSIEDELTGSGPGIASAFQGVVGDAVGAAFNISGKSPLIFLLVPTFGAIAGAITAVVGLVYALAAALLTLPAIVGSLLLQFGVLYLVFKDIGGVITKAFAAENIYQLADAFKGVNPYIQNFVEELIYIRDAFKAISGYLSIEFFKNLGNILLDVFDANRYTLFKGLFDLAGELGRFFSTIGEAFKSPEWLSLLSDLFKITTDFLVKNGPAVKGFLTDLFKFLDSLTDDASAIGNLFNQFLGFLGQFLGELAKNKDFQDFMKRLPEMLTAGSKVLGEFFDLLLAILNSLTQDEWIQFFDSFAFLVKLLADFFKSDVGQEAMKTFIEIVLGLTFVFDILVGAVGDVLAAIGALADGLIWLGTKIVDFFKGLWKAISDGLTPKPITEAIDRLISPFLALPTKLFNIGREMIRAFISGISGQRLAAAVASGHIIEAVAFAFPHSPAKIGPFSGTGSPYLRGVATMRDYSRGILAASEMATQNVNNAMSNVSFGTGAVIANFYGSQPTPDQARGLGTAVGNGIGDQLLARNARLAVRTM